MWEIDLQLSQKPNTKNMQQIIPRDLSAATNTEKGL